MLKFKKIFLTLIILFIPLTLYGCTNTTVDVDIKDVENTKITINYDNSIILKEQTAEDLQTAGFEVGNYYISGIVQNNNFQNSFNEQYEKIEKIFDKDEPELSIYLGLVKFSVESSYFGYPIAGCNTLKIKNTVNDDNIIINFKNSTPFYVDDQKKSNNLQLTASDFQTAKLIKYNVNSIESIKETINQQSDNNKVIVNYDIYGNKNFNALDGKDSYASGGYKVDSVNDNNIKLSKEFNSTKEFNYVFNLDNANIFNIIGYINLNQKKSLVNTFNVSGTVAQSSIKNYTLDFRLQNNGHDNTKNAKYFSYKQFPIELNIKSSTINWGTLIVCIICVILICLVIIGVIYVKKKIEPNIK